VGRSGRGRAGAVGGMGTQESCNIGRRSAMARKKKVALLEENADAICSSLWVHGDLHFVGKCRFNLIKMHL
jgi:hypothetical protein